MIAPTQPDDSTNEPTDDGPSGAYPDFVKAEDSDGIRIEIKRAMMAITTSSSIRVKAFRRLAMAKSFSRKQIRQTPRLLSAPSETGRSTNH